MEVDMKAYPSEQAAKLKQVGELAARLGAAPGGNRWGTQPLLAGGGGKVYAVLELLLALVKRLEDLEERVAHA